MTGLSRQRGPRSVGKQRPEEVSSLPPSAVVEVVEKVVKVLHKKKEQPSGTCSIVGDQSAAPPPNYPHNPLPPSTLSSPLKSVGPGIPRLSASPSCSYLLKITHLTPFHSPSGIHSQRLLVVILPENTIRSVFACFVYRLLS